MTLPPDIAMFYTAPGRMTDPGAMAGLLDDAPTDVPGIVAHVQNLLLHEHWAPAYRMRLSPERRDESNIRPLCEMLALIHTKDVRPLAATRTLYQRMVGVCRHFAVFAVALLRRRGIPARARVGFGSYFAPGKFEDHWVVEYWNGGAWRLLDAQIDAAQRAMLRLDFDTLDLPPGKFLSGAQAWIQCRDGRKDASRFGIFDERGLWFIASNLLRDFAALNGMEMLPWDDWGPMPKPDAVPGAQTLALFDGLAALCRDPDAHFAEMRALYDRDAALRVPRQVFNFLRKAMEPSGI